MNVLIIEKDMKYCNKLIKIIGNSINLKFCMISTYYDEIENSINEFEFNIIFIDFDLLNDFKYILEKYNDIIMIIYSGNDIKLEYSYINKKDKPDEIILKITNFLNNSMLNYNLTSEIKRELKYLGYNPKYYGTKYLLDAIYILIENQLFDCKDNLEKEIYPIIAKKYGKTVNSIKCNIINATDIMVYECEEGKLLEYLGYYDFSKPGPKKIIESIILKISKNNIIKNSFKGF